MLRQGFEVNGLLTSVLPTSQSDWTKGAIISSVLVRLAHLAFVAWLLGGPVLTHAQEDTQTDKDAPFLSCASLPAHEESTSGPEVSITNVTFSGFIQMPTSDQDQIVASIKQQRYDGLDGVVEEALERVKAGWQNHGYFKAEVTGDAKTVTTSLTSIQLSLFVHVEENAQYQLGGITFKNNKVLSNSAKLRELFPIKDGDVFSREKVAKGLEYLSKAYGEYGYINYTGVPSTIFDDDKKFAFLEIDIDEGKQFYVSRINVEGIGAPPVQQVLKELAIKPGDIYNSRLWELSKQRVASLFADRVCSDHTAQLEEQTGTIALTLEFRPRSLR